MTALYLVRHAQPVYQGYQETPELAPLSEKGRADSERLADFLQGKGIEQIYSSPYPRAVQTLEPLARRLGLPIELEPDLRERTVGSWVEDFSAFARRQWEDFDYRLAQGESCGRCSSGRCPRWSDWCSAAREKPSPPADTGQPSACCSILLAKSGLAIPISAASGKRRPGWCA